MDNRFFFITTYDGLSGSLLAEALNQHQDMHCDLAFMDPFIITLHLTAKEMSASIIQQYVDLYSLPEKSFNGSIQRFSAYELQHRTLVEKTKHPLRKANIVMAPQLRINFLLNNWIQTYFDSSSALEYIEEKIIQLRHSSHQLFKLYNFDYFYNHIKNTVVSENLKISTPQDKLFLIALTLILSYDSADLPLASKAFKFEDLVSNSNEFIEFLEYLTAKQIAINESQQIKINEKLQFARSKMEQAQSSLWSDWQYDLLKKYLNKNLYTIYYPHIDKPLSDYYHALDYQFGNEKPRPLYSKLISIQLNSNRPSQLVNYFDSIEDTADNPHEIEVIINIDDNDTTMEELLIKEMRNRSFVIKYTSTPRPKSFCDLWKPINKLLQLTDANAYFLLNISDEMLFATKGWDSILKKYVGYFPDHIFRLRASRNKFRNYFDRWECSFGQDSIPITTKKWVDIGGDWNPCFGPDSFQQLISFYLAKEGQFSSSNFLRELPLLDIQFYGDVPSLGMDPAKMWKHNKDHIRAMQICQSYRMQLQAKRRAMLLKANILAHQNQISHFELIDVKQKKQINILNQTNNSVFTSIDYSLNPIAIFLTNQYRKLRFYSYFGGGKEYKRKTIMSFAAYLAATHQSFHQLHVLLKSILHSPAKVRAKSLVKIPLRAGKLLAKLPYKLFKKILNKTPDQSLLEKHSVLLDLYKMVCLENEKLQKLLIRTTETMEDKTEVSINSQENILPPQPDLKHDGYSKQ
jgi:hypothetical protein